MSINQIFNEFLFYLFVGVITALICEVLIYFVIRRLRLEIPVPTNTNRFVTAALAILLVESVVGWAIASRILGMKLTDIHVMISILPTYVGALLLAIAQLVIIYLKKKTQDQK